MDSMIELKNAWHKRCNEADIELVTAQDRNGKIECNWKETAKDDDEK